MAYAKNSAVVVTLSGSQPCTDGSVDITAGEIDTTNLLSPQTSGGLLQEENDADTVKTTLNFTVVCNKASLKTYTIGALVAGVSYAGDDGVTYSGSARIFGISKPISTKGAFKVSLKTIFSGAVAGL